MTDVSIIQGKKFKKYQNKIKENIEHCEIIEQNEKIYKPDNKREGFINIFETNKQIVQNNNRQTSFDKIQLNKLNTEFNGLLQEYADLEKTMVGNTNITLDRYSTKNPYKGKNLKITNNGAIGYVTDRGDYKWYGNPDIMKNTAGKNGCPSSDNIESISINNYADFNTSGNLLNSLPSLLVGTAMINGQSCGNEGQNVFVNSIISNNIKTTYKGCYLDKSDSHAMTFLGAIPPLTTGSLQNGNFEQPQLPNNSYKYISSNTEVPGWNFYAVLINNSTAWGYSMPYPKGSQAACIQGTQVIGQWMQFSEGTYNVSFNACGRYSGANTIKIYLGINTILTTPQTAPVIYTFTPPTSDWQSYSSMFNITENGLYAFGFYGTITADKSTAIQNIQITQTSSSSESPTYTYDMCKDDAINNGYKYFGLQNMNPSTGYGYCAVSNDEIRATKYGPSTITSSNIPLWSSNTQGNPGCSAILNNQGSLSVVNSSGASIFSSSAISATNGEYIGCYGDNPDRAMTLINDGKGLQRYNYDSCQKIAQDGNYKYFALQNSITGQNAACSVSNDWSQTSKYGLANNCTKLSNGIVSGGGWANAVYGNSPSGQFYLLLDNNSSGVITMGIYRGSGPTNNQGFIWSAKINGLTKDPNPNYVSTKGKYGQNWITVGSTLAPGDFIGTTNGSAYLIMQSDGNLVLYTSQMKDNCVAGSNNTLGGGVNATALYDLNAIGNPGSMGKIGFIDNDANLREYPSSMIGKSTNYEIIQNYDAPDNNLPNMPLTNTTVDACKTSCNNNNDCNGFVYDNNRKLCYLKNNDTYPKGKKNRTSGIDLYTRTPNLKNNFLCPKTLTNIDSVHYDNYVKGNKMTPEDTCNMRLLSNEDNAKLNSISTKLNDISKKIINQINKLYNDNVSINHTMDVGEQTIDDDFKMYFQLKKKIEQIMDRNKIEPMLNMNDLNTMATDSDLIVLQNNYQYVLWSIIAVGIVIITINNIKK
jgi:hypothetical protein